MNREKKNENLYVYQNRLRKNTVSSGLIITNEDDAIVSPFNSVEPTILHNSNYVYVLVVFVYTVYEVWSSLFFYIIFIRYIFFHPIFEFWNKT